MKVIKEAIGATVSGPSNMSPIAEIASDELGRAPFLTAGKPLTPVDPASHASLAFVYGALKHIMRPVPGVDITEPAGEVWDAERDRN